MDDRSLPDFDSKKRNLNRYRRTLSMIERLENKKSVLENRLESISSPRLSDMPKGGVAISNEDLLADKIELEERIERLKDRAKRIRKDILNQIDELDDVRHAEVLESYFIERRSIEEISESLGYDTRHTWRLYTDAISLLSVECQ